MTVTTLKTIKEADSNRSDQARYERAEKPNAKSSELDFEQTVELPFRHSPIVFGDWWRKLIFSPLRRRVVAFVSSIFPSCLALYFLLRGLQHAETAVLQFRPWGSGIGMIEITSGLGMLFVVSILAGRLSSAAFIPFVAGAWIVNLVFFFSSETWLWDLKATIGWSSCTSALTAMSLGGFYSCWINRLDSPYRLQSQNTEKLNPQLTTKASSRVLVSDDSSTEFEEPTLEMNLPDKFTLNDQEKTVEDANVSESIRLPGNRKSWRKALIISFFSALSLFTTLLFQAGLVETDYNSWVLENSTSPIVTILVTCAITFGAVFLTGSASFAIGTPLLVTVLLLMVPPVLVSINDLFTVGRGMSHPDLSSWSIMGPVCGLLGAIAFLMILASLWARHSPHYQPPKDKL